MKKLLFTVTNDLTYDQRMQRICSSLATAGYDVTLIGRRLNYSEPLQPQSFRQIRIKCIFNKGKLFYTEYNLRLFSFLMTQKFDVICGIDLDTIWPTWWATKLKRKPFVYDAHEYFTEMEEVVSRPAIKKAWKSLEKTIVPKVKHAYTVSEGYAELFKKKYGTEFEIIRNATILNGLPENTNNEEYILYQGAVNVGRGLDIVVRAMQNVDSQLVICGKGDVYDELRELKQELNLKNKVSFTGYLQPEKLKEYTYNATIGITIFTKAGLSNKFSLANRFFDYLHAGVPQIAMNYPEYRNFNEQFEVALLIDEISEESITNALNKLLTDKELYKRLRDNCLKARKEFNWQKEEKKLLEFYDSVTA